MNRLTSSLSWAVRRVVASSCRRSSSSESRSASKTSVSELTDRVNRPGFFGDSLLCDLSFPRLLVLDGREPVACSV